LSASQLFTWRRLTRQAVTAELQFVPAVLAPDLAERAQVDLSVPSPRSATFAGIEIAVADATMMGLVSSVRVGPEASEVQIAAGIWALKGKRCRDWSASIGVVHRRVWWIREGEGERLVDAGADPQIRV
jgi:hypothetical protein